MNFDYSGKIMWTLNTNLAGYSTGPLGAIIARMTPEYTDFTCFTKDAVLPSAIAFTSVTIPWLVDILDPSVYFEDNFHTVVSKNPYGSAVTFTSTALMATACTMPNNIMPPTLSN